MNLLELYKKTPYEPLVPTDSRVNQEVFKFNSPTHFISWISGLDKRFERGDRSNNSSNENEFSFSLSHNLEDAYQVIREHKFESKDTAVLERKISELKKGTVFSDEGYEIDVPEHLAGSDKVWLKPKSKKTQTRIVDDILIIDGSYNCMKNAEECKKIGMAILEAIYRRRIIPRKLVVGFCGVNIRRNERDGRRDDRYLTAVDVSFSDMNGIAKMLHPSAFRRLWFRLVEIYPDLTGGYGRSRTGNEARTKKGYISIDYIYDEIWSSKQAFEREIDVFLGTIKN